MEEGAAGRGEGGGERERGSERFLVLKSYTYS